MAIPSILSDLHQIILGAGAMVVAVSVAVKAAQTDDMRRFGKALKRTFNAAYTWLAEKAGSPFLKKQREKNKSSELWANVILGYTLCYIMVIYAVLHLLYASEFPIAKSPWYAWPVVLLLCSVMLAYAHFCRCMGHRAEWQLREMKNSRA